MACPPETTLKNLTGKYTMNKTLSDSTDPILTAQGINWILRKTLNMARVTVHIVQSTTEEGVTRFDVQNYLTANIKVEPDHRILDWAERERKDRYFGDLMNKARYIKLEDLPPGEGKEDLEYINAGEWDETEDKLHVQVMNRNEKDGWIAIQIWGFEMIDGVRYHVHRVVMKKGSETHHARIVYDWLGPLEA